MVEQRWSLERAQQWQLATGWSFGCNFSPSTAGNQLELWQPETFDPVTIDRELGWAAQLGMNTVRVYLHDLLFSADPDGFLARIDEVLSIADGHGIKMMPVLFDGVWHPFPKLGAQPEPKPRLHNSMWVQSPGNVILSDESRWSELQPYVETVVSRYGNDPRVLIWDLFNEPDQVDATSIKAGTRKHKAAAATRLVAQVFAWARGVQPMQPLTVGVWEYADDKYTAANPLNELALAESDVISFHCYEPKAYLQAVIAALAAHDRPLLCTEWLARTAGSTVDLIEVFHAHGVGALNWGLVDGRTQTRFPWRSWTEPVADDEPWFHELLHADGTPYDQNEAALLRKVSARSKQA